MDEKVSGTDLLEEYKGLMKVPGLEIEEGAKIKITAAGALEIYDKNGIRMLAIDHSGVSAPAYFASWWDIQETAKFTRDFKSFMRGQY